MSLLRQIAALFRRQSPPPKTTDQEITPPNRPSQVARLFSIEPDRKSIVALARRMAAEDPRADAVLHAVARDVTRGGFTVSVPQQPNASRARQIAMDLINRLNATALVEDWTRETLRDGDGFYELAVDGDGLIQNVSRKPTLEMRRMSDLDDRFAAPERAFCWSDEIFVQAGLPPRDAVYFAAWQIIHARWAHDEANRYGLPMLASGRQPWLYATEGERDVAVRRKTRAGMRYVHSLEDASEGDIAGYRERNRQALEDPNVAIADFFAGKKTSISAVQGDAHLSEIDDVTHHITTAFFNAPIPLFLLGYGEQLNRDVLEQQQAQYDRALDGLAVWIDDQLLIPLIERQWLLQGIWPPSVRYTIQRPSRTPITAALLADAAGAATALRGAGLPERIVVELLAQLIPGLDVDRVLSLIAEAPPPPLSRPPTSRPPTSPLPGGTEGGGTEGGGTEGGERRNGHAQEFAVYARG